MVDRQQLLADLKPLLRVMEADLRARCDEVARINTDLTNEYNQARAVSRVGVTFEEWRADLITQVAVAWVLSSVFVRFLEDNGIISPPRISGLLHSADDGQGLMRARDERDIFFRLQPKLTDRDYLLTIFDDLAKLPGTKDVFGPHNHVSVYRNWLSGDAAQKLIEFFQKIDKDGTGEIIHDFADDQWDTRFLGDLYQDLSEVARKKFALLQTPVFVEEFILERTLEPAIKEFGLKEFKMIDPACGSGHFILGAFARILNHWRKAEPGTNDRELVNRAIAAIHGVDLNPYAVAIARFRLLLVAMKECRVAQLKDAPNFRFNLACGDSLLHGSVGQQVLGFHELAHHYQSEDIDELRRMLKLGQYHAVVANPPYITVKDKALNQAYRDRYPDVCHRKYSLSVPFMKRLFEMVCEHGFTGQITANSFMKREFGKKLVESYLPKVDLTHVIDTSGAYIPGHGTPTAIIFGRNRRPVSSVVRAVMGIRGEPTTPTDPALGLVWAAILQQIDCVGSQSEFVSVSDTARKSFSRHPWSIGGGGAAELKELLDEQATATLNNLIECIGFGAIMGEDDCFSAPPNNPRMRILPAVYHRPLVEGELVRNWFLSSQTEVLFPYTAEIELRNDDIIKLWMWQWRTTMGARPDFGGKTYTEAGRFYWEYHQIPVERNRTSLAIVFGSVATHNHFVLDHGGKVCKQSAPMIKLHQSATETDHLALLGLLNSSVACFWMQQTMHNKGGPGGASSKDEKWHDFYDFSGMHLQHFPLPADRPTDIAHELDVLAQQLTVLFPDAVMCGLVPTAAMLAQYRQKYLITLGKMIALQEELDWECYRLYGLLPLENGVPHYESPPPLKLGQRAFEIGLARQMVAGEVETKWFTWLGIKPTTECPDDWPDDYRRVVQQRIEVIKSTAVIALLEDPRYKRRWETEPWEQMQERALHNWLLDRLESYLNLGDRMHDQNTVTARGTLREPRLISVAKMADLAKQDVDFMQVAELYTGRMDFDVANLVGDLVLAESVPCLPVLLYRPTGLDKRAAWERTWELQRLEDDVDALFELDRLKKIEPDKAERTLYPRIAALRINEQIKPDILHEAVVAAGNILEVIKQGYDPLNLVTDAAKRAKQIAVGDIPVPPKYTSADFLSGDFWRLRGKLDVPKERWVSFPHCEGEDGTLVIAWAGYDHLQLARAIAERYEQAKEHEGRKHVPLLASIGHMIPWLKQWHNELDLTYGDRMGDYFENYLAEEAKAIGMSVDQVMAWTPPAKANGRGKRKAR